VKKLYPHLRDLCSITLYDVAPGILQSFDKWVTVLALVRQRGKGRC
jgi:hypothetical protein